MDIVGVCKRSLWCLSLKRIAFLYLFLTYPFLGQKITLTFLTQKGTCLLTLKNKH